MQTALTWVYVGFPGTAFSARCHECCVLLARPAPRIHRVVLLQRILLQRCAPTEVLMHNKLPENAGVAVIPSELCMLQALQLQKWPAGWQRGSLAFIPCINSCSGCHD